MTMVQSKSGREIATKLLCCRLQHFHRHPQMNHMIKSKMKTSKMTTFGASVVLSVIFICSSPVSLMTHSSPVTSSHQQSAPSASTPPPPPGPFPGVSRELGSFCASRPSLPIELASMVVHVKRNVSFNYKLYLFSGDYVFQTGQVIPRDDFRIHSFPVKHKRLGEFWPSSVPTFQYSSAATTDDSEPNHNNDDESLLVPVPSQSFKLKRFLQPVRLHPHKDDPELRSDHHHHQQQTKPQVSRGPRADNDHHSKSSSVDSPTPVAHQLPDDAHGHALPGDPEFNSHDRVSRVGVEVMAAGGANSKRSASVVDDEHENLNKHIDFDRDDQVSVAPRSIGGGHVANEDDDDDRDLDIGIDTTTTNGRSTYAGDTIVPVGAFSSFHVNLTYLVRKDFGQMEPELLRIQVDASKFLVTQLVVISNGTRQHHGAGSPKWGPVNSRSEDYGFLSHKLLRDPNTRITAINQIYEDWITRNFYTIVYIQRRLDDHLHSDDDDEGAKLGATGQANGGGGQTIVNDRLVFRGNSMALLGADQLDYSVKAAAFITEKNGLHYYLEFLNTNKFYLCAIDWTKRPFKIIDSRQFPIKATRTQLDNEELLLCPPAVCYSNQPIDEIVSYGHLSLSDEVQKEARILSSSSSSSSSSGTGQVFAHRTTYSSARHPAEKNATQRLKGRDERRQWPRPETDESSTTTAPSRQELQTISLDRVIEAIKHGSSHLQVKLHLRDWLWTLERKDSRAIAGQSAPAKLRRPGGGGDATSFGWRYESARRNDIKAKPDTYGYALTGHEIDASYRVYNELYLISANHLITINYTMANETVISTHPIGDEFPGLSSTLLDPITGAFYDRYANQIFFFKGDRYLGYDYASKKPLEEFLLRAPASDLERLEGVETLYPSEPAAPLISSLPVVGILGRQHQVDGLYHDLQSDLVYVFTGMRFYTFEASEFKDGLFKPEARSLPQIHCINEHFLHGCNFDQAFKNPCTNDVNTALQHQGGVIDNKQVDSGGKLNTLVRVEPAAPPVGHTQVEVTELRPDTGRKLQQQQRPQGMAARHEFGNDDFGEEQQMKLRSIAARPALLSLLVEKTLLRSKETATRALEPLVNSANSALSQDTRTQEKIVVYLLMAMIVITLLVTLTMILVMVNWMRMKMSSPQPAAREQQSGRGQQQEPRIEPGSLYLSNQQQQQQQQQPHHHSRRLRDHRHGVPVHSRDSIVKSMGPMSVVVTKGSVQSRRASSNVDNSAL